jgi:chloramphenicol 3-O phosphotransferase
MSVDSFLVMMPDHAEGSVSKWIRPFLAACFESVACFARAGFPVIVDTVFEHRDFVEDYKAATRGIRTIYVGLDCPVDVLEKRERKRRDRRIGMARIQSGLVHRHVKYDLRLDTDRKNPKACSRAITRLLTG